MKNVAHADYFTSHPLFTYHSPKTIKGEKFVARIQSIMQVA